MGRHRQSAYPDSVKCVWGQSVQEATRVDSLALSLNGYPH